MTDASQGHSPQHGQGPDEHTVPSGSDTTIVLGAVVPEASPHAEAVSSPGAGDQAAIAALPAGCALLVTQRGPGSGARFLLDADRVLIGRSERADILLDDVTVSRKHAQFVREGSEFLVRDSGSLNGTYVNRQRVDSAVLRAGDEVQIGKFRMIFYPSPRAWAPGADA